MNTQQVAQEVAEMLLKIKAVTFRFDPPYTYTTGLKSPIYTDISRVISFPDVRRKVVNYLFELMANIINFDDIDYVSGTATAGIPLAALMAEKLDIPMIYVRKATKKHGLENLIEGYLKKGSKVVVIEDIYSTGSSAIHNSDSIRRVGGKVDYSMAIMTYEIPQAEINFKKNDIKKLTLTTGKIVAKTAFEKNILTEKEKKKVIEWFDNPYEWAKKL